MSDEHNYRIISNKPLRIYDYFKTQQELDAAIARQTNRRHTAEFYQPGIGWVRYNPQPVDYAAIIRRLVEAGDAMASSQISAEECYWCKVRNCPEVKKVMGES